MATGYPCTAQVPGALSELRRHMLVHGPCSFVPHPYEWFTFFISGLSDELWAPVHLFRRLAPVKGLHAPERKLLWRVSFYCIKEA